ncbi:MAG: DUF3883 domain-containing protein [Phycisphaerae bacterium]|nr:DUF3883 domain-containing protein [Phycisphaerae bacterium]
MKTLFCNIGWMESYKGQSARDQIQGGGSYVQEKGMGHEVCNFAVHQDTVYGYVQPPKAKGQPGEGQIRIERIGGDQSDFVTSVLVVWTAARPEGGTVVVGWYKGATVYRHHQEFQNTPALHKKNNCRGYWIKAKSKDAVLLPVDQRTFEIPRKVKGGMGQANVWFADSPDSANTLSGVSALVAGKRIKKNGSRSRVTDPEHNAKVEEAAIKKTRSHFEELGYRVESVENDNVGWDLEATAGRATLRIEVKGLSGTLPVSELTPNEFNAFSTKSPSYRLAIVTNSLQEPHLIICRYSSEQRGWVIDGHPSFEVQVEPRSSAIVKVRI